MTSLEIAVDSINLELIIEQLDLGDWMPGWLIEHRAMEEEEVRRISYTEVALRTICLRARESEEVLKDEYGVLDPLLYHDDD